MRTFTFSDGKSHKFWNIELSGNRFTVTYGKIGGKAQTQTKTFADAAAAKAAHDKLVREKLDKGYVETTPSAVKSPREVLEGAILADPDDRAAHAAYADFLTEQGDPQGEFIRVQLELENESLSAAERKKLQKREKELLDAHLREWLGPLEPVMLDGESLEEWQARSEYWPSDHFVRGILAELTFPALTVAQSRALVRAADPTRLVRRLIIEETAYEEPNEYEAGPDVPAREYGPCLYPLARWAGLKNLRVFQLGKPEDENYKDWCGFNCHTEGEQAYHLVKQMPRVEELRLLAHGLDANKLFAMPLPELRVLQVYHTDKYPLDKLAKNASLAKLTHLLLHPHVPDDDVPPIRLAGVRALVRSPNLPSLTHLRVRMCDMGDAGCREIVASGILKRLKELDLRHGTIRDEGAKVLAACPDLKNLQLLDVSFNELSRAGIKTLRATGVPIRAHAQGEPSEDYEEGEGDWEDREHLFQGDIE